MASLPHSDYGEYQGSDPPHQHTQFLDLTNGEGGERPEQAQEQYEHQEEEEESLEQDLMEGEEGDEEDDGMAATPSHVNNDDHGIPTDPRTPGRVVETGAEHTGRWTKDEHESFLAALQTYGKEWKKVAAKVKTRTVVQTRTHAQKYFQKLQKAVEGGGSHLDVIDMGVEPETKKASSMKKKKSRPAAAALAQSIIDDESSSNMPHRRSSNATLSAAQVISGFSAQQMPMANYVSSVGSTLNPQSAALQAGHIPRHGFSMTTETPFASYSSSFGSSARPSTEGWMAHAGVKIVAPDPHAAMKRGDFPEPSPAATGKRKLAEIAAARMLAGVAGAAGVQGNDDDGPPTPPPVPDIGVGGSLNMKNAPPPPLLFGSGNGAAPARKGLSLQIVNPETLGITFEEQQQRRRGGGGSPVTPWDGQLEALVSEKARSDEINLDLDERKAPGVNNSISSHPVCGVGTTFERTELHKSVCDVNLEALKQHLGVLANLSEGVLQRKDEAGYCPLHTACAMSMARPANAAQVGEMVRMLLGAGADPKREDAHGNTPLHWSARAGDRHVTEVLLLKNCPQDAKNEMGETALHWAMRAGDRGMDVVTVLLENGSRPGILSLNFRRPIDVAADGFADERGSSAALRAKDSQQQRKTMSRELKKILKDTAQSRRDTRANLLIRSSQSRTLVLHHPECLDHIPKSAADWEAPDRITSIMRRVFPSSDPTGATETSGIFPHEVTVSKEFERANLDVLSRIHSTEYLSFVNELSKDLEKQVKDAGGSSLEESEHGAGSPPVVPFTPMVQRTMIKVAESSVKLGANSDTSFSAGSLRAARRAAGAVQHAVDCVLVGRNRNAFCVVRPPGHHAGSSGLLEGGESCGFCIFNNVAAGAMYAISDDRLLCERCAVIDIDTHHGNGTEEIIRKFHDPSKLFFFSVHLYDNDRRKRRANEFVYKFYPGTGAEDDLAMNVINVPITPLWREGAPATAPSKKHNTRRKAKASQSQDSQDETSSEMEPPRERSDNGSETGSATANVSAASSTAAGSSSGRLAYRQAIQNRLLPALRAFNPDLILISAGFDAARGDVGNARHERGGEKMGIDLEPEDYAWTTRKICEIADICCQGRVVSVLEGGYGRTPATAAANPEEQQGLDRTVFAECGIRHLHALIDPYDKEKRFSS